MPLSRLLLPLGLLLLALLAVPHAARAADGDSPPSTVKILLVGTKPDHPWASHMYMHECRLLAACLQQVQGVETVISLGWPEDEQQLDGVKSIVFYSRPAGDIVLHPDRRAQFLELMKGGVGYAAIHWGTGAGKAYGREYLEILGAWFNTKTHSGLKTTRALLRQVDKEHPACRGWEEYELHEEYYLDLKFREQTRPVLQVKLDGKTQTVAWAFERPESAAGRSFGCTLGHFHENFTIPAFRKCLANGILWTAHIDVPADGVPVAVDQDLVTLPPKPDRGGK